MRSVDRAESYADLLRSLAEVSSEGSAKHAGTRSGSGGGAAASSRSPPPYLGVSREPGAKKWRARIRVNGNMVSLGSFDTAEEAARAVDEARRKNGSAAVNFPQGTDEVRAGRKRIASGFKGVSKFNSRWRAIMSVDGKKCGPWSLCAGKLSQHASFVGAQAVQLRCDSHFTTQ